MLKDNQNEKNLDRYYKKQGEISMKKNNGIGKHLAKYFCLLEELADYHDYTSEFTESVRRDEDTNKLIVGDALSLASVDPNNPEDLYDLWLHIEDVERLVESCRDARSRSLKQLPCWTDDGWIDEQGNRI